MIFYFLKKYKERIWGAHKIYISKVYTGWRIPYDSRHNYNQYFFRQIT